MTKPLLMLTFDEVKLIKNWLRRNEETQELHARVDGYLSHVEAIDAVVKELIANPQTPVDEC